MIADVKLALQKDGFILLLSIRPSVGMSAHPTQMLTFWVKVLPEVFFFCLYFESFFI